VFNPFAGERDSAQTIRCKKERKKSGRLVVAFGQRPLYIMWEQKPMWLSTTAKKFRPTGKKRRRETGKTSSVIAGSEGVTLKRRDRQHVVLSGGNTAKERKITKS